MFWFSKKKTLWVVKCYVQTYIYYSIKSGGSWGVILSWWHSVSVYRDGMLKIDHFTHDHVIIFLNFNFRLRYGINTMYISHSFFMQLK